MLRYFLFSFFLVISSLSFAQLSSMYVGTYTSNGSKGVYIYEFDAKNGDVKFQQSIGMSNPSFLARKGNILYAVNEDKDGMITAIDLESNSILNSLSSDGAHPCHVSLSPKDPVAVVSNYSGGSLALFSINGDGSLNKQEDFIQFSGSSIDKNRQKNSHIHSAFFTADGTRLFVSDLGSDLVTEFDIIRDSSGSFKFRKLKDIKVKAGGGPRHVVIGTDATRLYVVLELTGEIEVLELEKGIWKSKQIVAISDEGFNGQHGAADIKMSADGKYVYATNRGDANCVVVYAVSKNGLLKPIEVRSVEGVSPRNLQLSPDGNWVIVGNQVSGNLSLFRRDKKNGQLLGEAKIVQIPSSVCTIF